MIEGAIRPATPVRPPLVPERGRVFPGRVSAHPRAIDPAGRAHRARSVLLIVATVLCAFDIGRFAEWAPGLASLPFAKLLLPIGAVALLARRDLRHRLSVLGSPQGKAFAVFLAVIAVSIPTSLWPGGSFGALTDYLMTAVPPLVLFAAAASSLEELSWLVRAYVVAMISLGLALKLGFGTVDSDGRVSISSTYDANDLALIAVVGFPLACALLREKARSSRVIGGLGVLLALFIVGVSASRGGMIGLAVVVVLGLIVYRHSLPGWGKWLLPAALVIGLALAPPSFWERFSTLGHLNDDYNVSGETGRVAIWERGVSYFEDRPITGVGFAAYPVAEGNWAARHRTSGDEGFKFSVSHNSFVQVAAELGTLGLVAWLALFIPTFFAAAKARRLVRSGRAPPSLRTVGDSLALALVGFFVSGFFLSAAYGIAATTLAAFGMAYWGMVRRAAR